MLNKNAELKGKVNSLTQECEVLTQDKERFTKLVSD